VVAIYLMINSAGVALVLSTAIIWRIT